MKIRYFATAVFVVALCTTSLDSAAHENVSESVAPQTRADSHAPIGVMGDHRHGAEEWMLSYRYMRMGMEGSRNGTNSLSPEAIVSGEPNRFSGLSGQPPTLRVVPTEMTMEMHMFGIMYAPTDWVTLMTMVPFVEKSMDHVTFQGPTGTGQLGQFTTTSSGLGDLGFAGLVRILDKQPHRLHLNLGLTVPTGSIDERDSVLTPMGTQPRLRLPYPMQLGSGTVDLQPGVTYFGMSRHLGWGAQYRSTLRVGRNDEGYSLGDVHMGTAWGSILWAPWVSTSVRVAGSHMSSIDGLDSAIVAPVQTADPDRQGGDRIDIGFGLNLAGTVGRLLGHRIALEWLLPIHQDLNGPQLETDATIVVGYQYAFK